MSQRTPAAPSGEDLSVRARRERLSTQEQHSLERSLQADPELALAHRLGAEIDRETAPRSGDEQLIERAVSAALGPLGTTVATTTTFRLSRALWVAGATTLCAGAVAVLVTASGPRQAPLPSSAAAGQALAAAASERAPSAATLQPSAAALAPSAAPSPAKRAGPSAARLFRQANAARGRGDPSSARRDYTRLTQSFPESDEAQLAHISLGKLLQAQGSPAEAERAFVRYLASGRGQLDEEALVSRAHALRSLQRRDDEQNAWRSLLRQYPASVYAKEAEQRLRALSVDAADAPR